MQLQPLAKREPYRSPPRLLEDREPEEADEKDLGANQPAALALRAETPAEVVTETDETSPENAESAAIAATVVDSAPNSAVPDPRPELVIDGFGAGLEVTRPPDPPPDESVTRRG